MPIETICQGCQKKLRVADEHAGKQARCPGCGNIYVVPQPTPLSYSPPSFAEKPASVYANPPAKEVGDRWFMKIDDGREFGPVDRPTLDQWLRENRIGPSTRLKREFDSQWQLALAFFPSLAPQPTHRAATANNPFSEQAAYAAPNPYATPGAPANYGPRVEPHRGGLILALGLISWFSGCFIVGIVGWVLASTDLSKMRRGEMDSSGYGLTQAGMIIGMIHAILVGLFIGGFFLLALIGAVAGN
ncbi:MAG TPA: hypothetical protein VL096_01400 [Pirellulaceae bacterium]|nr:hypothetical protein [Pirellulaceae bacterium]